MGKIFLTENEISLLTFIKRGNSRKSAAVERNKSIATVNAELNIIYKKFNVHSLQELWHVLEENNINIP